MTRARVPLGLFFGGFTLYVLGDMVATVAVPWLVLSETGSAADAGVIGGIGACVLLASSLVGGVVADRVGRQRVVVLAALGNGAAMALVPVVDGIASLTFGWFVVIGVLGAIFDGPGGAANEAFVADLCRSTGVTLERLNGVREGILHAAMLAGPALAGWGTAAWGASGAVTLTAVAFTLAALLLAAIRGVPRTGVPSAATSGYLSDALDGLRYLVREPALRAMGVIGAVEAMVLAPFTGVLLPAHMVVVGSPEGLGLVLTLFACGGLGGSVLFGFLSRPGRRRAWFVGSLAGTGLAFGVVAALPGQALLLTAVFVCGVAAAPISLIVNVLVQERAPDAIRARVFGLLGAVTLAAVPFGMFAVGLALQFLSVRATAIGTGVLYALLLLVWIFSPATRDLDGASPGTSVPGTDEDGGTVEVDEIKVRGTVVPVATLSRGPGEFRLWPSVGEYPVYDDVLYRFMGNDTVRNDAFHDAIGRLAGGALVADVGTGKDALWALAAARAGARHVYAVEELPVPLEKARKSVGEAGLADRITVLGGTSAGVELPERVEVCVSEVIGTIGSSEGAATVLADARERFLTPAGTCIPARCTTMVAAVRLDGAFPEGLAFHRTTLRYVEKIFEAVGHPFDVRVCLAGPVESLIVSSEAAVETLDFNGDLGLGDGTRARLTVTETGPVHAFVLWIRLQCRPGGDHVDSLRQTTSWLPVIAPLSAEGIPVEAGDTIDLEWRAVLSGDGLHPDYRITGEVVRPGRSTVPVEWTSYHHEPVFRATDAYRALFPVRPLSGSRTAGAEEAGKAASSAPAGPHGAGRASAVPDKAG
ncbi:hypothetical protein GCM10010517_05350 [Streptosporangium fragile]|uniref:Multidrug efflux pump Tap n=1 Tax=Streptosporangium fragile TaxID=46186 RepID=A0ABN3VPV4_9ACTN